MVTFFIPWETGHCLSHKPLASRQKVRPFCPQRHHLDQKSSVLSSCESRTHRQTEVEESAADGMPPFRQKNEQ